ncbi:MAG: hypothetical protein GY829_06515 [Gammaproteobacteria bacterium]|nr:hypothetical protein [Gammaproteobacteria bacterium]
MNSDDNNPTAILGDLEDIRNLLDKTLLDEDGIPILEQSIPELNKKVEITDNFNVSLDAYNSTETVEQQLASTHHEEAAEDLELIPELTEELPITTNLVEEEPDEPSKQVSQIENITDNNQYDEGISADHPQTHQHVSIQNEELKVETLEQQQDIEQIAEQEFENNQTESFDEVEMADLILKNAWIKVEMLLMENLPPQLSGAFLELLNSRVEENKLQLFEELALLDKDTFNELLEAAKIDQDF